MVNSWSSPSRRFHDSAGNTSSTLHVSSECAATFTSSLTHVRCSRITDMENCEARSQFGALISQEVGNGGQRSRKMDVTTNQFETVTQQMRAINLPKITAPHVFCHHRAVVFFCILDHECIHLRDNLVLSEMAVLALRHFLLKNLLTTIHERIFVT